MTPYNSKTTSEDVATDCSNIIRGKVILTTGVTPGSIGATFVTVVARHSPKLLILAGRNTSKCHETAIAIQSAFPDVSTRILELDLGSLEQVRTAAAEVNRYPEHIDVLCNNAGVMIPPYSLTTDGLETQFAVNHVGHFLFTNLIMPKLLASPSGARVVNVSSNGHRLGPVRFDDWRWDGGKTYDPWRAYGQAKTANMLFALALAKRRGNEKSGGLVAVSLHPGVVATNLMQYMGEEEFKALQRMDRDLGHTEFWGGFNHLLKNASEGAATHVYAAFHPSLKDHNGAYLADSQVHPVEQVRPWARDPVEADMLWKLSEEIVGQKFEY
ncbi:MAG: hypothetical protein Q9182_006455 [Xanthomendoza sp. 2 TL-2023]